MNNPITALVRRFGKVNAVAVVAAPVVLATVVTPDESWFPVALLVATIVLVATAEPFRSIDDGTELGDARAAYAHGEITLSEFERRAELILDERAGEIRDVVEEVGGVGPETSAAVALAFESVDELRMATDEELQAIHGVGPSTSAAIREHVVRSTAVSSSSTRSRGVEA